MKTLNQHFINGQWQKPTTDNVLELLNPSTEQAFAKLHLADKTMALDAIKAAKEAQKQWAQTPATVRARHIQNIVTELKKRRDAFTNAMVEELGCPKSFAEPVQVDDPIDAFEQHINWTLALEQKQQQQVDKRLQVRREAIGVCVLITPWNYPLHQLVAKVAPALAAGCSVVVKPSELTPQTALLLAQAIDDAKLPAGVFNLVIGLGQDIGDTLTQHQDVDCISFTGSTQTGVHIQTLAAKTVKRVCLELGGKSPYIIADTDNLQQAVALGVEDVMVNSGQTCVALTRMLVHESQYEAACELAKTQAESLQLGAPEDPDSFIGPVVSKGQYDKVLDYIKLGVAEGANLLTGGKVAGKGYYIAPTIFSEVDNSMKIAQQEIFGPVLCIIAYKDIEQAIHIANDSPYGLSARVWHDDRTQATQIASQIRAGQVYINDAFWHNYAPFGGYKQSGNGRELGPEGINEFLETKSIIF